MEFMGRKTKQVNGQGCKVDGQLTHGLANRFRERIGLGPSDSAIVSWPDPDGAHLAAFGTAGVAAAGRAGRARVSFHLWNDLEDVDLAARTLGR